MQAVPGAGSHVPLYILGSSLFGARLAAAFGLPYAFASHFAPAALEPALAAYRDQFTPSAQLDEPYAMAAMNVLAAETREAAREQLQAIRRSRAVNLFGRQLGITGDVSQVSDEQADEILAAGAGPHVDEMLTHTAVGTADEVRRHVERFIAQTGVDELITAHPAPDPADRLRSVHRCCPRRCGPSRLPERPVAARWSAGGPAGAGYIRRAAPHALGSLYDVFPTLPTAPPAAAPTLSHPEHVMTTLAPSRKAAGLQLRPGPFAGRYPAVAAMVVCALVPYLALSGALGSITPLIAGQLHMSLQTLSIGSGLANAAYAAGTVLAVQFAQLLPQRRMVVLYATVLVIGSVLAARPRTRRCSSSAASCRDCARACC